MRHEGEEEERGLLKDEVIKLLKGLPSHLVDLVIFSLATRLRQANVLGLCYRDVNLDKRHPIIFASQSKTKYLLLFLLMPMWL